VGGRIQPTAKHTIKSDYHSEFMINLIKYEANKENEIASTQDDKSTSNYKYTTENALKM
jgi:hypothetical protein